MSLVTRLFPALAVIMAAFAYFLPGLFDGLGDLIVPLLTLVMFAMGLTLTLDDFRRVARRPSLVAVGTLLQFLLMPLAAMVISRLLVLDQVLMVGMVLVGCCPGGTASNVICYLSRGDVALSISLTMVSTLLSVLATPFLVWAYLGLEIDVPVTGLMLSILQVVIVPVFAGLLINTWLGHRLEKLAPLFTAVSVLAIVVIIAIVVALNRNSAGLATALLVAAVILHNLAGLGSGYGLCKLLGYDEKTCRTIAIEVGMQNSGLGVALAAQFFNAAAALPGAVFSLWHNLSGSLLAGFWGKQREK